MVMSSTTQQRLEPMDTVSGITLLEGEEAYISTRPSFAGYVGQNLLMAIISLGLLPLLWKYTGRYIVTNQRVYRKTGILNKRTDEYRYEDIQQVSTGKSLVERLLGVGNVKLQTGTGGEALTFWGVPEVDAMANIIRSQLQDK